MNKRKKLRRPTCLDIVLYCQICGKVVREGLFNTADFFRCELNHITCAECFKKSKEKCGMCGMPYIAEELKTLF
ncbi:MAG: hypothetical protein GF329_15595 [Candidatus Lokiarchaeota archaeon]|nr:hypothetical protein [Candidatus Lokiarchaeota archaeon]